MNEFERKVADLLRDGKRLNDLLRLEKQRRDVARDALVFIGIADVAEQRWCEQKAVFTSRKNELGVFASYLSDRLLYAHRLGFIAKFPRTRKALLEAGGEITEDDIQKLIREKAAQEEAAASRPAGVSATWHWREETNDGKRTRLINPDLPAEEKELYLKEAVLAGTHVVQLQDDPRRRGRVYEGLRAERYPRIRWHFPWGRYSVGGEPDGLAAAFVYEFKTTRNRYLYDFMRPGAFAQADLYGHFFRRPKKRVQILVVEENATETCEVAVDGAQAEQTLAAFARVDAGEPARPPVKWKCKRCEFRATCPISQAE